MNVSLTIGATGGEVSLLVGSLVLSGPAPGPASGSTVIHVTATANLPYTISLNGGLHLGPGSSSRALVGNAVLLPYYLYSSPDFTQPWGNNDAFLGPARSGTGTGSDQAYTAYGLTASYNLGGTTLPNGLYTDVVTVAVDF